MKYLKKFNESNENIIDRFNQWVEENLNYTSEDVLYYFSEFTDEFEYEYEIERFPLSINQNYFSSILKNGFIEFNFTFTKSINLKDSLDKLDQHINFGEEVKSFKIYLTQFKNLEEDVKDIDIDLGLYSNDDYSEIKVIFKKLIPTEILNQFKKEFPNRNIKELN